LFWACRENGRKWNSQKSIIIKNLEATRLRGRQRNRWQDEVRRNGKQFGGIWWKGRVYKTEKNGRNS
jgi:hypothetical protein